jgi:hypothetical protein
MTHDATLTSGLPSLRCGAPRRRCRWLPISFALGLILAGLMTGLLTLAGAALMGDPAIGAGASLSCTGFTVGGEHEADVHLHLENAGPERTGVRLDFFDDDGLAMTVPPIGGHPILGPWASVDLVFRSPAHGGGVELTSSGRDLRASAVIRRDDGAPPQVRKAIRCLASDGPVAEDRGYSVEAAA